jgi:6-phosphogluconate dehydrogenase
MQLGMIGLGRMGANMVVRLMRAGHDCHVFDTHATAVQDLVARGAKGSTDLKTFVNGLSKPRAIWMMVPAGAVDAVLGELVPLLSPGDIVIDGGNSTTICAGPSSSPRRNCTTSMSASAAVCGVWSAATA